jgi:hypothetical protein
MGKSSCLLQIYYIWSKLRNNFSTKLKRINLKKESTRPRNSADFRRLKLKLATRL